MVAQEEHPRSGNLVHNQDPNARYAARKPDKINYVAKKRRRDFFTGFWTGLIFGGIIVFVGLCLKMGELP